MATFDQIFKKKRPLILPISSLRGLGMYFIRCINQAFHTIFVVTMRYMPRTQYVLRFLAIFPPENDDKMFHIRQYLYISFCVYYLIGITIYPLATINDPNVPTGFKLDNFLKTLCLVIFTYNFICTFYLRDKFVNMFKELEDFGIFGKPPKAEQVSKLMDVIAIALIIYCTVVALSLGVYPLVTIRNCIDYNKINNTTIMCGFGTSMRFPYDFGEGWFYYLHICIQFYCGTTMCAKGVIFFGLTIGGHESIILRFNHLISKLKDVYCDNNFLNQKQRLRHCIMYHIRILELATYINNSIALLTMPCLITYNIIIGTSLLVLLNVQTPFSFINTVGWVVSLFIGCLAGERIITASTAVGEVVYDLKWYADTRLRRDLQFMILRSQRPIRLQCGELGELTFLAFKKIMQGAYTYATMKSGIGR